MKNQETDVSRSPDLRAPEAASSHRAWICWVASTLVATAAVALAVVHLPPVAKKLVLLAVAFGFAAGWLAARLAVTFQVHLRAKRGAAVTVFLVILVGQVGIAVESHRVQTASRRRALSGNPKSVAALRLLQSAQVPADPLSKEAIEHARQTVFGAQSFADYLRYRVADMGTRAQRGAIPIWISEILLGSVAGTWLFRRLLSEGRLDTKTSSDKLDS